MEVPPPTKWRKISLLVPSISKNTKRSKMKAFFMESIGQPHFLLKKLFEARCSSNGLFKRKLERMKFNVIGPNRTCAMRQFRSTGKLSFARISLKTLFGAVIAGIDE